MSKSISVGIMTFHWADNFGAVFQAYALQDFIKKLGFKTQIIDFRPPISINQYINKPSNNDLRSILKYIAAKLLYGQKIKHRINFYENFRKSSICLSSKRYSSSDELKIAPPICDIYLVGSDQVWNPSFVKDIGYTYFLDFLPPISYKISYAASVVEQVPIEFLKEYKYYLEQFRFISVREKSSKRILEKIVDKPIHVCLDPVFLLNAEEWRKICKEPKHKPARPFILVLDYVLNEGYREYVNWLSTRTRMPVVSFKDRLVLLMKRKTYSNHLCSIGFKDPREILWYLSNAEFVLTSSFHGLAFALIFNKKFVCMVHPTRGNRMTDLLTDLKMEKSLLYPNSDFDVMKNVEPMSITAEAYEKLIELRNESINYLKHALMQVENTNGRREQCI